MTPAVVNNINMRKEVFFTKSWKMLGIITGLFLIGELLFVPTAVIKEQKTFDFLIFQFLWLLSFLAVAYQFIMQKFIKFYEDGISFWNITGKTFLFWSEITEFSSTNYQYYMVTQLKSTNSKVNILFVEYKDKFQLAEFLDQKLKRIIIK